MPVDGSDPAAIPFSAPAEVAIGPELKFEYRIEDTPTFTQVTAGSWQVFNLRLTAQPTGRDRINVYWDEQLPCQGRSALR